jgi:hypothetical protein
MPYDEEATGKVILPPGTCGLRRAVMIVLSIIHNPLKWQVSPVQILSAATPVKTVNNYASMTIRKSNE